MSNRSYIVYTADDEEPECGLCDHFGEYSYKDEKGKAHDLCAERCGAKYGWLLYKRTELVEHD